jgi:hypothetical protein
MQLLPTRVLYKCGLTEEQLVFKSILSSGSGRTSNAEQQLLSSTNSFKSAAVPGRRNTNSTPAQSPVRWPQAKSAFQLTWMFAKIF